MVHLVAELAAMMAQLSKRLTERFPWLHGMTCIDGKAFSYGGMGVAFAFDDITNQCLQGAIKSGQM